MERLSYALSVALVLSIMSGFAAIAQSILPPAPDAKGGGNPLQGLGRKDDPSPPRYDDYLPKSTQRSSILDPVGGLGSDSGSSDLGSTGSGGTSSGDTGSSASGTGGSFGTDALEKTLDANGLKLQDVPKMMNRMHKETARVAGEAGIEMGGNEGFAGSGGSSLDAQPLDAQPLAPPVTSPLASPLTAPPAPSTEDVSDGSGGSYNGSGSGDSALAGLAGTADTPDGSGPRRGPPGNLNAAGEYENGPAGLPPGPGMPTASETNQRARQARTVSPNVMLKSPRAQEATDKIRSAIGKQASRRIETTTPRNGLVSAPPPVMPLSAHQPHDHNTPERQALQMIHKGEYAAAEDQLRSVVSGDPSNLHARYLLAVALVYRKNYDEAKTQYNLIIQKSQDSKLIDLATAGLQKIDR